MYYESSLQCRTEIVRYSVEATKDRCCLFAACSSCFCGVSSVLVPTKLPVQIKSMGIWIQVNKNILYEKVGGI